MRPWTRAALVAAAGGALSAFMAALLDPAGFSVKYRLGEGKLALMVVGGAVGAVAGLFMRSPADENLIADLMHRCPAPDPAPGEPHGPAPLIPPKL